MTLKCSYVFSQVCQVRCLKKSENDAILNELRITPCINIAKCVTVSWRKSLLMFTFSHKTCNMRHISQAFQILVNLKDDKRL